MKRGGVDGGEIGRSPWGSGLEEGVWNRSGLGLGLGLGCHSDGVVCRWRLAGLPFSISREITGELSKSNAPFPVYTLMSITDRLMLSRTVSSLWPHGRPRGITTSIRTSDSRFQSWVTS